MISSLKQIYQDFKKSFNEIDLYGENKVDKFKMNMITSALKTVLFLFIGWLILFIATHINLTAFLVIVVFVVFLVAEYL